jgi:hypothetical protein
VSVGSGVSDGRAGDVRVLVSVEIGGDVGVAGVAQEERSERRMKEERMMRVVLWRDIKGF